MNGALRPKSDVIWAAGISLSISHTSSITFILCDCTSPRALSSLLVTLSLWLHQRDETDKGPLNIEGRVLLPGEPYLQRAERTDFLETWRRKWRRGDAACKRSSRGSETCKKRKRTTNKQNKNKHQEREIMLQDLLKYAAIFTSCGVHLCQ